MNPLRLAVIGVGALGRHHARILSQMDGVQLVAVAEPSSDRGREAALKHHCEWVADYRELFHRVDAVSIVAPTVAHRQVAGDFLEHSIAVFVEKPLAASLDEAEELVALAQQRRATLQVGHIERFNPAIQAAKFACGTPTYIRAQRVSPFTFRSTDIGVVLDLMIHDLDLSLWFAQSHVRTVEACGMGIMGGYEDMAQARITFENGCMADLTASRVNTTAGRTMQIWSKQGWTEIDMHTRTATQYRRATELRNGTSPIELASRPGANIEQLKQDVFGRFIECIPLPIEEADALTAELQSFVDAVRQKSAPVVDGLQGLLAMDAADRVLRSIESHRWSQQAPRFTPNAFPRAA